MIVVLPSGCEKTIPAATELPVHTVPGGATRYESVRRGLEEALRHGCSAALIHDAARPFAPVELFREVLSRLRKGAVAVVPVIPVADTIKRIEEGVVSTVRREDLYRAQTPQGLSIDRVLRAYDAAVAGERTPFVPTDDVALAELGGLNVETVEGDPLNFKITDECDWRVAEAVVAQGLIDIPESEWKVPLRRRKLVKSSGGACGVGFDAHRLEEGIPLRLGGIDIPHPFGLAGHSDGDVVAHAVVDALAGAARLGDIGSLYPSSDERNRGRRSTEFLEEVSRMVKEKGLSIASVDVTIVAEEPRLEPYKPAIRDSLAEALCIDASLVSVKATTTDGLGLTGSKEGIAAFATALVEPAGPDADQRVDFDQ